MQCRVPVRVFGVGDLGGQRDFISNTFTNFKTGQLILIGLRSKVFSLKRLMT